jgi:hypothetical protein
LVLWHAAAAVFLFRWIFRDPKVDLRFLVAGVLAPDIVDLTFGTVLLPAFSTGELWMHTLLTPTVVTMIVLAVTRRGARRKAWMAFAIGMFFHLFIDGMWTSAEVFLWPAFGTGFPPQPAPYWPGAWDRATSDIVRWALELVGLGYCAWLWRDCGLADRTRRRAFVRTGVIESAPGRR